VTGVPAIRHASAADAALLAALHCECFDIAWSEESFVSLLADGCTLALLATRMESVAFIVIRVAADEAEILTVATIPSARRSGLARNLIQAGATAAAAQGAVRLCLEVSEKNVAAQALYRSLGFSRIGARKAYYRGPSGVEDALMLAAPLPLCE